MRRRHLPEKMGGTSGCDERVGRMCWRYSNDPEWTPRSENPAVTQAREALLEGLDRIGNLIPGDRWVLGQRVWYLLKHGRVGGAVALTGTNCAADPLWCQGLLGLALHRSGDFRRALQAFPVVSADDPRSLTSARGVEDEGPARWLMGGDTFDWIRGAEDPVALWNLYWKLGDPLLVTPGNERLAEHLARQVEVEILQGARTPHGIPWGRDLAELHIRYGPEVGWAQVQRFGGGPGPPSIIGQEDPLGRQFTPTRRVLEGAFSLPIEGWIPEFERPREAFAPPHGPDFRGAVFQVGRFWRGDSVWVLGAVRPAVPSWPDLSTARAQHAWRPDLARTVGSSRGLFALAEGAGEAWRGKTGSGSGGTLALTLPRGRYVLSVESVDQGSYTAARARFGLDARGSPEGLPALSDLVLLEPEIPRPEELTAAAEGILPSAVASSGASIRVAWELGGRRPALDVAAIRLTVSHHRGGLARRFGEWVGVLGTRESVRVEWEEPAPLSLQTEFHLLDVDLPDLEPGIYVVELEVSLSGRDPLRAAREIRITRNPGA